eukprot:2013342-Pleurochrysis_carterae.AAC.1
MRIRLHEPVAAYADVPGRLSAMRLLVVRLRSLAPTQQCVPACHAPAGTCALAPMLSSAERVAL